MKRWALLKSKLKSGKSTDASINAFEGMALCVGKTTPWQWSCSYSDLTGEMTEEKFVAYMENEVLAPRDCYEVLVRLTVLQSQFDMCYAMVWEAGDGDDGRIRRVSFDQGVAVDGCEAPCAHFDFYFKQLATVPLGMPECRYLRYELPPSAAEAAAAAAAAEAVAVEVPVASAAEGSFAGPAAARNKACIYTREHILDRRVTAEDIQSHVRHGVDNTGNMRVWDAEALMLHSLITCGGGGVGKGTGKGGVDEHLPHTLFEGREVLELGGGMTGMCGLGLAAVPSLRPSRLVVTDGHPTCARNIGVCVAMNQLKGVFGECKVSAALLKWDLSDSTSLDAVLGPSASAAANVRDTVFQAPDLPQRPPPPAFDVALVCDCLFFRDFHLDLIHVLVRCVRPRGKVLLMQPPRDGTMLLFLQVSDCAVLLPLLSSWGLACTPLFLPLPRPLTPRPHTHTHTLSLSLSPPGQRVAESRMFEEPKLMDDYCDEVSRRHAQHTAPGAPACGYDADIHLPRLVILTLK
jgi:predicted nicotinamide N-methyase